MKFNRYIFDLYLESFGGQESQQIWSEFLEWESWERVEFMTVSAQTFMKSKLDICI